jgi:hypothetical protein
VRVAQQDPRAAVLVIIDADANLARLAELIRHEPPPDR